MPGIYTHIDAQCKPVNITEGLPIVRKCGAYFYTGLLSLHMSTVARMILLISPG